MRRLDLAVRPDSHINASEVIYVRYVPRISAFYGINVYIYSREHGVAHFHARYGDDEAVVEIATGTILDGALPRRQATLVSHWWALHQDELREAWNRASSGEPPGTIEPLP